MTEGIGKIFIILGISLLVIGILLLVIDKLPLGLGKLPGDIYIKRDNFVFYFPLATSLILSVVISLIFFVISRLSR